MIDRAKLPDSIDDRQLRQLRNFYFGKPEVDSFEMLEEDEAQVRKFELDVYAAIEERRRLINENSFYDTGEIANLASTTFMEIDAHGIINLREQGQIIGVPDHRTWLYPAFQFETGTMIPSPLVSYVHNRMRFDDGTPADPWEEFSYWNTPRDSLGGQAFKNIIWNFGAKGKIRKDMRDGLTDSD